MLIWYETWPLLTGGVRFQNMNRIIYTIFFSLIFGLSIAGTYEDDFIALQKVDTADGINQEEAYVIAKAFFWSKISGCGFPIKPIKEGGFWVSKTRVGYAGVPGDPIYINEKTGNIKWGNKNSSITLDELKKSKSNNRLE